MEYKYIEVPESEIFLYESQYLLRAGIDDIVSVHRCYRTVEENGIEREEQGGLIYNLVRVHHTNEIWVDPGSILHFSNSMNYVGRVNIGMGVTMLNITIDRVNVEVSTPLWKKLHLNKCAFTCTFDALSKATGRAKEPSEMTTMELNQALLGRPVFKIEENCLETIALVAQGVFFDTGFVGNTRFIASDDEYTVNKCNFSESILELKSERRNNMFLHDCKFHDCKVMRLNYPHVPLTTEVKNRVDIVGLSLSKSQFNIPLFTENKLLKFDGEQIDEVFIDLSKPETMPVVVYGNKYKITIGMRNKECGYFFKIGDLIYATGTMEEVMSAIYMRKFEPGQIIDDIDIFAMIEYIIQHLDTETGLRVIAKIKENYHERIKRQEADTK